MFVVTFCPFNIECNRGLRSMISYDELFILECDSRHSLSYYFFRYSNLIRHYTNCVPLEKKNSKWPPLMGRGGGVLISLNKCTFILIGYTYKENIYTPHFMQIPSIYMYIYSLSFNRNICKRHISSRHTSKKVQQIYICI